MDGCQQESQGGPRRTQLRSGCTLGGGTSGMPWVGAKGSVGNDGMAVGANPMTHGYDVYTLNGQEVARCLAGGNVLFLETVSDGSGGCYAMTYPGMEYSGEVSDRLSEWKWGGNLFLETFFKSAIFGNFLLVLSGVCLWIADAGTTLSWCGEAWRVYWTLWTC